MLTSREELIAREILYMPVTVPEARAPDKLLWLHDISGAMAQDPVIKSYLRTPKNSSLKKQLPFN